MSLLDDYARVAGPEVVDRLRQLAERMQGMTVVHVNATRVGGGVAEILDTLLPLSRELGLDARWLVVDGDEEFFHCTKSIHNGLQGNAVDISDDAWRAYEDTNARNAEAMRDVLEAADFVFIHDPQPAALLAFCPNRRGKWIWRCHIDASNPHPPVWEHLRRHVAGYDASVFSLAGFAQALDHPEYLIPPSIDPLAEKNVELGRDEVDGVRERFGIDPERRLLLQISRFDRFKDPVGVIEAYRMAKRYAPDVQLALAGGGATDDPEAEAVLEEVRAAAGGDPDVHLLTLPPDAHRTINALQRSADIVLQKSLREGFGLTVTEAMWKGKPVIGGNVGGIRLQVVNHHTGFLVSTPEGASLRMRYLLHRPERSREMGREAREFVRGNFLITRQLREYLTLMVALLHGSVDRIELSDGLGR